MLFFLLFLLANEPSLVIQNTDAEPYWVPTALARSNDGRTIVLNEDQSINIFSPNGTKLFTFASKGQGPGQTTRAFDVEWLEVKKEIWVADIERTIVVHDAQGRFKRDIKLNQSCQFLLMLEDGVLVCPASHKETFLLLDFDGKPVRRFNSSFEFDAPHYKQPIWQMFLPIALEGGQIGLGYVWANKFSIIDRKGVTRAAFDMEHYYDEYVEARLKVPSYFSQNTLVRTPDGHVWILTCDASRYDCKDWVRIDPKNGRMTGRALASYDIRHGYHFDDGSFGFIDRDDNRVLIYETFPFALVGE